MPFTEKRLAGPTQLTTSSASLYTVPSSKTTIVKQIVATNTSVSAANFSIYIGAATAANAVFNATSVAANDSLVINLSQVLATGEVLNALASANTAINLTISGVENDGPLTPNATYIADNAITTAKLADASVTSAKILDGTIATGDIANNAITQAKLASSLSGITVTTSALRATAVPSPFTGQTIYQTDNNQMLVWNGSAWVCITPISAYASDQPATTSTTPATLSNDPSVTIQTGTKALIMISARQVASVNAGYIRTGVTVSGATSLTAVATKSIENYFGTADIGNDRAGSFMYVETGLTAGLNTFQMQHWRGSAGTMVVTQRSLTVVGIP